VRELRNVILRAAAIAPCDQISAADLLLDPALPAAAPAPVARADAGPPVAAIARDRAPGQERAAPRGTLRETVLESEREALLAALDACDWNFARAAQQLGVSRMTLYRRLNRCGISRAPGEP
jgi:transcriptional regulator of acetoin/glycerol metabolism